MRYSRIAISHNHAHIAAQPARRAFATLVEKDFAISHRKADDKLMADIACHDDPEVKATLWRLYQDFFDKAEKKRRWSLRHDIPWSECNRSLNPELADVVESFCAGELYLPDYIAKIMPLVRSNRGRAWFHAHWGYEESKHSLALGDWLLPFRHAQR